MQKKFVPMYPTIPNEFKPDPILHPIPQTDGKKQSIAQIEDEYYELSTDEPTQEHSLILTVKAPPIDWPRCILMK